MLNYSVRNRTFLKPLAKEIPGALWSPFEFVLNTTNDVEYIRRAQTLFPIFLLETRIDSDTCSTNWLIPGTMSHPPSSFPSYLAIITFHSSFIFLIAPLLISRTIMLCGYRKHRHLHWYGHGTEIHQIHKSTGYGYLAIITFHSLFIFLIAPLLISHTIMLCGYRKQRHRYRHWHGMKIYQIYKIIGYGYEIYIYIYIFKILKNT